MIRRPPRFTRTDTLFPYTTLFRSVLRRQVDGDVGLVPDRPARDPRQDAAVLVRVAARVAGPQRGHEATELGRIGVAGLARLHRAGALRRPRRGRDRKSTRLNSSH